ncbi:glutamine synthetase, partial [Geobacillus sp. MMMUD3]|nr:glutamine synthetase [Geobacillus sp. MMMUD3]
MSRQEEFVLRTVEDREVRFIRLWFTDVLGGLKSVAIVPAELEGAFSEGIGFDGSAVEGLSRVYEADMVLKPDPSTFSLLPWRGETEPTGRMFCDIHVPGGEPAKADPRNVLKRTLEAAAKKGFTFYVHPEIEFYLFRSGNLDSGNGTLGAPVPVDTAGYFDHVNGGTANDFRRSAVTMLEAMGLS